MLCLGASAASAATSWDFTTGLDGFVPNTCATLTPTGDGSVLATTLCDGAGLTIPGPVDATNRPFIELWVQSTQNTSLRLWTGGTNAVTVAEVRGDGRLRRVWASLAAAPGWTGAVTGAQLLLQTGLGGTVTLSRVSFLTRPGLPSWTFDEAGEAHGVTAIEGFATLEPTAAGLVGTVAETSILKPRLAAPAGLELAARDHRTLLVELSATAPTTAQKLRILWGTSDTPTLNQGSRSTTVDYIADGTTKTLRVDLFEHAKWRGTIVNLWIQPLLGAEAGATVTLRHVGFPPVLDAVRGPSPVLATGVGGLRRADGALRGIATMSSATLAMPVSVPLELVPFVTVAARFATGAPCAPAVSVTRLDGTVISTPLSIPCDGVSHRVIVDLKSTAPSSWTGWGRELKLTLPGTGEVAVSELAFHPSGPALVFDASISTNPQRVGAPATVTARIDNLGVGPASGAKLVFAGAPTLLDPIAPGTSMALPLDVGTATDCTASGKTSASVSLEFPGSAGTSKQALTVPIAWRGATPALPEGVPAPGSSVSSPTTVGALVLQNDRVRIALLDDPCLGGLSGVAVFVARGGTWLPVGGRPHLGRLVSLTSAGAVWDQPLVGLALGPIVPVANGLDVSATRTLVDPDGVSFAVTVTFGVRDTSAFLPATLSVVPNAPRTVLHVSGPSVEVGLETEASAVRVLVSGSEWTTSLPSGRAAPFGDYIEHLGTPDPKTLAQPFLGVTTSAGLTAGLVFSPAQSWSQGGSSPAFRLVAPNHDDGRTTALAELLLPSAPGWVPLGEALAAIPYAAKSGETLKLTAELFAVDGDLADALEATAAHLGNTTPAAFDMAEVLSRLAKGAPTATVAQLDVAGAPSLGAPASIAIARRLGWLAPNAAMTTAANNWASAAKSDSARAQDGRYWSGLFAAYTEAWAPGALAARAVALDAALAAGPLSGVEPSLVQEFEAPGARGAGFAARLALGYLDLAWATGHAATRTTGLDLLAKAGDDFRGGRLELGIPASAPVLGTAVDLLLARLAAHRLTGDAAHLAEARRIAFASIAFVVRQDPPGTPSGDARYSAVPAFGSREFVTSLLGTASSQEGARLANALLELRDLDTSSDWLTFADGLLGAVIERMGPTGLVPASWAWRPNGPPDGPNVLPLLVGRALLRRNGNGPDLNVVRVSTPAKLDVTFASAGVLASPTFSAKDYVASVTVSAPVAGQPLVLTAGGLPSEPATVWAAGVPLPKVASLSGVDSGSAWSAQVGVMAVKVPPSAVPVVISVAFPIPDVDQDGFPANLDCDDSVATIHPGAPETCNGKDDDCDLAIDEGTGTLTCGVGQCAHSEPSCQGGAPGPCHPNQGQSPETCDLLDNDCDGETDEEVGDVSCGIGQCQRLVYACDPCDPMEGAEPEVCDTVDNDCDGTTDESPGSTFCGTGKCEHAIGACDTCDPFLGKADEVCNLIDDDCDGETDDGLPTTPCGTGQCLHDIPICAACDAKTGSSKEVCDSIDNDCDGETDEGLPTKPCGTGQCLHPIPACQECQDPLLGATIEVCDQKDNDCNGITDDSTDQKPCGTGICYREIPKCDTCNATEGAVDEVCDLIDNDCDGETDEQTGKVICGLGVCAHEVDGCKACDMFVGKQAEACNLKDDDCDGKTDEPEDLGTFVCGTGQCERSLPKCTAGGATSCDAFVGKTSEACDGKDNDCDGATDEDIEKVLCGQGECAHEVVGCVLQGPGACDPFQGKSDEVCNGKDDDCNGATDDGLGSVTCGAALGCERTVPKCVDGKTLKCDEKSGLAPEICDGVDQDCDAATDEGLGLITCGEGICKHGVPACTEGKKTFCDPFQNAQAESCNFLDDDCNGTPDDNIAPIACGKGICVAQAAGCVNGAPAVCTPLPVSKPEVCNNKDDDCDGDTDEGQAEITCGKGICQQKIPLCMGGVIQQCDPQTGAAPEACNGKDDDCDGDTDEDLGTQPCGQGECARAMANCIGGVENICDPIFGSKPEVCNGKDDDCDGVTDNPVALGTIACPDGSEVPACAGGKANTCSGGGVTGATSGGSTGATTTGGDAHGTGGGSGSGSGSGTGSVAPAPAGSGCASGSGKSEPLPLLVVVLAVGAWFVTSRERRNASRGLRAFGNTRCPRTRRRETACAPWPDPGGP